MTKIKIARVSTLIGYFGLLILIVYWALNPTQLNPEKFGVSATSVILLFGGLPLIFGISGILKKKPYTHAWVCIVSLLYLIHGIVEVWSQPENKLLASTEIFLSVLLYLGAGFYARYRSRELKAIAEQA
ncbi:MAG: DUF2069 domain-containing protein [Gammaproteobacteria bacterium]